MAANPFASLRVLRKKYAKGIKKATLSAIYRGYSLWNEDAYRFIIGSAPKAKAPSKEYPPSFIRNQIKLVTRRARGGYVYREVDVPSKFQIGSPGWRAWLAIKALHMGWQHLPFDRPSKPLTGKRAMGLPVGVIPGRVPARGRKRVAIKKVTQKKQITKNPWIKATFENMEHMFLGKVERALREERKVKKKEKLA